MADDDRSEPANALSWEGFSVDLRRGELRGPQGLPIHLRRQSLQVLLRLAATPGTAVSRAELVQEVWGQSVVTDDSLVQCVVEIRRALGPAASRAIRTLHRRGYVLDFRTSEKPRHAVSPAAEKPNDQTGPHFLLPLRGRDDAMAELSLSGNLGRATPRVVIITGEPGIGKSRLLKEAAVVASEVGALLLTLKCHEIETELAQGAVCRVLDQIVQKAPLDLLASLADEHRASLVRVAPWHREVFRYGPESAPVVEPPTASQPTRLRAALIALLASIAQRQRLVLALDDVQWMDAGSARLFFALAETDSLSSLQLWVAYRQDVVAARPRAVQLITALKDLPGVRHLVLGRLRADDVEAIARQTIPGQRHSRLSVEWLVRESLGNPFYLAELIRARQQAVQSRLPEKADFIATRALPANILNAVLERAQRLPEPAIRMLQCAAVAGAAAPFEALAKAAQMAEVEALQALETLLATDWLVEDSEGERYTFAHDKLQEAVYQVLPGAMRRVLHRRLAVALLNVDSKGRRPEHAVIAVHAREGGDMQLALEQFEHAGDDSQSAFQLRQAETLYSQALNTEIAEAACSPSQPSARAITDRRIALLKKRGAIRSMLGASMDAESDLRSAIELAAQTWTANGARDGGNPDDTELASLHLEFGVMLQRHHRLEESVDAFEQALRLATGSAHGESVVALAHSWLGDLHWMSERNRSARVHFQTVLDSRLPFCIVSETARTKALIGLGQCAIMDAQPRLAIQYLDQAVARVNGPAESFVVCAWHVLRAWAFVGDHSLGQPQVAKEHFERCAELAQKAELFWYSVPCEIGLAVVEAALGNREDAIARLEAVRRLPADVHNNKWRLCAGVWLAACLLEHGQAGAALLAAQDALKAVRESGPFMFAAMTPALVTRALIRLGNTDLTTDPLQIINQARQEQLGYVEVAGLQARVEWLWARGEVSTARECQQQLRVLADDRGLAVSGLEGI